MTRLYRYVGPDDIREAARLEPEGWTIAAPEDLSRWATSTGQRPDDEGRVTATFVIDASGRLRIADRHSEHVACAAGGPVQSAGEMSFMRTKTGWRLAEVSHLSTGFCPEPKSWAAVAAALDRIPLPHPGKFTFAAVFRRCPACGQRNVVKEGVFVCDVCCAELPELWNFG